MRLLGLVFAACVSAVPAAAEDPAPDPYCGFLSIFLLDRHDRLCAAPGSALRTQIDIELARYVDYFARNGEQSRAALEDEIARERTRLDSDEYDCNTSTAAPFYARFADDPSELSRITDIHLAEDRHDAIAVSYCSSPGRN